VCIIDLIVALEEEFRIRFDEGDLTMSIFQTVRSLSSFLERMLNQEQGANR
jgi:acyl carrier protein